MTIYEFMKKNGIKRHFSLIEATRVDENPNMPDSKNMNHWRTILRFGVHADQENMGRTMEVYFSQGYGHKGKAPLPADILDCLASDSASIENVDSFEEWADELGFDPDSRMAEKTYQICVKQAQRLKEFLGDQLYDQLLWDTERQ